jgi:hypothetical protein
MLHEYHVIYSVRYYLWLHVTAVGLGTYYQWIRGHYCMYVCMYIYTYTFSSVPVYASNTFQDVLRCGPDSDSRIWCHLADCCGNVHEHLVNTRQLMQYQFMKEDFPP